MDSEVKIPTEVQAEAQPETHKEEGFKRARKKTVLGVVVSNKMQKTIVVKVDRRVRHLLYKKYVLHSCRYKAHDEKNEAKPGDRVSLVESRPLSRHKRWVLKSIIKPALVAMEPGL